MPDTDPYDDILTAASGATPKPRRTATPDPDSALNLISKYESGDRNVPNFRYDPTHTAQGHYQITNTNWKNYGPRAGIDLKQYPSAMAAPKETQGLVAKLMYKERGFKDWAPFNPRLRAAIGQGEQGQQTPTKDPYADILSAAGATTEQTPTATEAKPIRTRASATPTPPRQQSVPPSVTLTRPQGLGRFGVPATPAQQEQIKRGIAVANRPASVGRPFQKPQLEVGAKQGQVERAFSARTPSTMERITEAVSPYVPGLATLDTPFGVKTDPIRGAVSGATLGLVGDPRQVSEEEKIVDPNAQAKADAAHMAGSFAPALIPYVAAERALGAIPLLAQEGRVANIARTALTFGGVEAGREAIRAAKTDTPLEPKEIAISTAIGAAMGGLSGVNPSLKRRLVAFITPQAVVDVARGTDPQQAVINGLTNLGFGLAAGGGRAPRDLEARLKDAETKAQSDVTAQAEAQPTVGIPTESTSGQVAPQLRATEGIAPRKWQHADFGEVTESPNQKRVGKGRVRVTDENGVDHVIKRAALTGAGNQRAIPLKTEPAQPETLTRSFDNVPLTEEQLAQAKREADVPLGEQPDPFAGIEDIAAGRGERRGATRPSDADWLTYTPEEQARARAQVEAEQPTNVGGVEPQQARGSAPSTEAVSPEVAKPTTKKEPWEMTRKEFEKKGYSLHKDIRSKTQEERDAIAASIREKGLERRNPSFGNTLPVYRGGEPTNVIDQRYGPRAGDRGYLIPKGQVDNKTGNYKEGYRPTEGEIVDFSRDYQSVHEAAVETALKQGKPVPPEVLADYPDLAKPETAPTPSVIKDYKGEPLTVYRGRVDALPEQGGPYFFSEDRGVAGMFAGDSSGPARWKPGTVTSANLEMKNPFETRDITYVQELQHGGLDRQRLIAELKAKGHDGVIYDDLAGDKPTYIVFNESQIKPLNREAVKPPRGYVPPAPTPTEVLPTETRPLGAVVEQGAADLPARESVAPTEGTTREFEGRTFTYQDGAWRREDGRPVLGRIKENLDAMDAPTASTEPVQPRTAEREGVASAQAEGTVTPPTTTAEPPESSQTAVKNESMEADRVAMDLPELAQAEPRKAAEVHDRAIDANAKDPRSVDRLVEQALATDKNYTDVETAQVRLRAQEIKNRVNEVNRELAETNDPQRMAELATESDSLINEYDRLTQATKKAGTEWGRAGVARQQAINQSFDLVDMVAKFRKAAGRAETPAEKQQITELSQRNKELEAKLADAESRATAVEASRQVERVQRQRARAESKATLDAEAVLIKSNIVAELARIKSGSIHASGLAGLDPEGVLTKELLKYAHNRLKANIGLKAEALRDELHALVADAGITPRQIDEVLAYGFQRGDKRSEATKKLQELRAERKRVIEAEDVVAGRRTTKAEGPSLPTQGPKKTRVIQSLEKQIKEWERKVRDEDFRARQRGTPPIDTAETRQLRSDLQRVKTQYQNLLDRQRPGKGWRNLGGIRKANMLSGISTQARNFFGTAGWQGFEEGARVPAAIADMGMSLATGRRSMTMPTPAQMIDSVIQGAKIGGREAGHILKHGATKEQLELHQFSEVDTGIKAIDVAANTVFRVMSASDRLFYNQALRRNLLDRATAQAKNEGVSNVSARAKEIANNPSPELEASAKHDALVSTFNNNNLISDKLKLARGGLKPWQNFAIDLVMPFDRTPTNVIARILEASPLGTVKMGKQLYEARQRGRQARIDNPQASAREVINKAMSQEEQRQFAQTFGRATAGTALLGLGWMLGGKVLSSDDNGQVFINLPKLGKVNINAISPVGNLLAIGANLKKQWQNPKASMLDVAKEGVRPIGDQPLLRAGSDVTEFIKDPNRSFAKTSARFVSSFVPASGLLRDVARTTDSEPNRFASGRSFTEQFKQNIPVLRQQLDVSRSKLFHGTNVSTPATKELERLNMRPLGVQISPKETPEQFEKRKSAILPVMRKELETTVSAADYQNLSDADKKKALESAMDSVRNGYEAQQPKERERTRRDRRERKEYQFQQ